MHDLVSRIYHIDICKYKIISCITAIMGHPSTSTGSSLEKKFKTELTDYSVSHGDKTGPYADDLDIDVLIVGAGFSQF